MPERVQTYKNHTKLFPLFHFVAVPILFLNFVNTIRHVYLAPGDRSSWFQMVVAFGLLAGLFAARVMALAVQDRVIRLEMQLRLARVLPADLQAQAARITPRQLVALRFASDDELPELVREVSGGRLNTSKEIKTRIKNWQGDFLRA
jgi:hypothetical protein